jgi:hypothetical protein
MKERSLSIICLAWRLGQVRGQQATYPDLQIRIIGVSVDQEKSLFAKITNRPIEQTVKLGRLQLDLKMGQGFNLATIRPGTVGYLRLDCGLPRKKNQINTIGMPITRQIKMIMLISCFRIPA